MFGYLDDDVWMLAVCGVWMFGCLYDDVWMFAICEVWICLDVWMFIKYIIGCLDCLDV